MSARMPVAYLPHGGGPWPFVDLGLPKAELESLGDYLRRLSDLPPRRPASLLVVSAHWEEPVPTVMSGAKPPMLYDYYGFPAEAYRLSWPAPGSAALASRVQALLLDAGIDSAEDSQRGFDHGTFIPLMLAYPEADVPTAQLSLRRGLDPREHLAIGRALEPLRDEGVFIIGSGMSYHNMRGFGRPEAVQDSLAFDEWLQTTCLSVADERERGLVDWLSAPCARACHPREEHLLPLMVVAGASSGDAASIGFSGAVLGVRTSAIHFGAP